jgi:hypothetical protein
MDFANRFMNTLTNQYLDLDFCPLPATENKAPERIST